MTESEMSDGLRALVELAADKTLRGLLKWTKAGDRITAQLGTNSLVVEQPERGVRGWVYNVTLYDFDRVAQDKGTVSKSDAQPSELFCIVDGLYQSIRTPVEQTLKESMDFLRGLRN